MSHLREAIRQTIMDWLEVENPDCHDHGNGTVTLVAGPTPRSCTIDVCVEDLVSDLMRDVELNPPGASA